MPYGRNLPVNWQRVGRTVAISAAALAAEVGLAMLKRRFESNGSSTAGAITRATQRPAGGRAASITTIVSQRIIEIIDSGDGRTQLTDRHVWQRTDE